MYKWPFPGDTCSQSYIYRFSTSLENWVKEHRSHVTSAIYICSESNNHLHANISHSKVIYQDSKQIATEAIMKDSRNNNPALNCNTGKMCIPEIFNNLLGAEKPSDGSVQMADPDLPQGHMHLTIPYNRYSRAVCGKLNSLSFSTYWPGNLPVNSWQVSVPYKLCSKPK